uniref:Uncharacterized protein n=1 Tax=Arundo donax TaxID=35708 RepID=A0A0A9BTX1_ARUDO
MANWGRPAAAGTDQMPIPSNPPRPCPASTSSPPPSTGASANVMAAGGARAADLVDSGGVRTGWSKRRAPSPLWS